VGAQRIRLEMLRKPPQDWAIPSTRTINRVLIRHGLVTPRKRRRPKAMELAAGEPRFARMAYKSPEDYANTLEGAVTVMRRRPAATSARSRSGRVTTASPSRSPAMAACSRTGRTRRSARCASIERARSSQRSRPAARLTRNRCPRCVPISSKLPWARTSERHRAWSEVVSTTGFEPVLPP
jgi:hypothetical protein